MERETGERTSPQLADEYRATFARLNRLRNELTGRGYQITHPAASREDPLAQRFPITRGDTEI